MIINQFVAAAALVTRALRMRLVTVDGRSKSLAKLLEVFVRPIQRRVPGSSVAAV
jgi:hypothetical protein